VILDIFSRLVAYSERSRRVVVAPRESAGLAEQLIAETVARHDIGVQGQGSGHSRHWNGACLLAEMR